MPLLKAIQQLLRSWPSILRVDTPGGRSFILEKYRTLRFFDCTSTWLHLKIACSLRSPPLSPLAPTIPTFLNELHPSLMRKRTFLMRTAHSLFVNSLCPPLLLLFLRPSPLSETFFWFLRTKTTEFPFDDSNWRWTIGYLLSISLHAVVWQFS